MIEKNLNTKAGGKDLLSEESEDYTLDDIIQLHKVEEDENGTDNKQGFTRQVPVTKGQGTVSKTFRPAAPKTIDYNLTLENNDYNLKDNKDIDAVLKRTSSILSTRVTSNVNRFSSMTYCEEVLQVLYQALEDISRNRGNAKEIIEIGSKIETIESEKQKQFISKDEVHKTIEDIKAVVSSLTKIQYILENSKTE